MKKSLLGTLMALGLIGPSAPSGNEINRAMSSLSLNRSKNSPRQTGFCGVSKSSPSHAHGQRLAKKKKAFRARTKK
ncbi:hypothetical protein [Neptunicella sp. SCSIO 80796]|uniref:hypothetical protein n=1 Tax=Neptunicella plasticusilytica TaxID=3117012 RepID=UPI003A4DB03A